MDDLMFTANWDPMTVSSSNFQLSSTIDMINTKTHYISFFDLIFKTNTFLFWEQPYTKLMHTDNQCIVFVWRDKHHHFEFPFSFLLY